MTYAIDLERQFGKDGYSRLASAYEAALLTVSLGDWSRLPDRSVRLAMHESLIREAARSECNVERMTSSAVAAARQAWR